MSHDEKIQHFLADMRARKISKYNAAPPIYRVLWAAGLKIPPPCFATFPQIVLSQGIFFGLFWGTAMWLFEWREAGMQPVVMVGTSALTGLGFGLTMAWLIRRTARQLRLPPWDDYPSSVPPGRPPVT